VKGTNHPFDALHASLHRACRDAQGRPITFHQSLFTSPSALRSVYRNTSERNDLLGISRVHSLCVSRTGRGKFRDVRRHIGVSVEIASRDLECGVDGTGNRKREVMRTDNAHILLVSVAAHYGGNPLVIGNHDRIVVGRRV